MLSSRIEIAEGLLANERSRAASTVAPSADAFAGDYDQLGVVIVFATHRDRAKTGWHWRLRARVDQPGAYHGPFVTSEAAYDGYHDYMGWVRLDKVSS